MQPADTLASLPHPPSYSEVTLAAVNRKHADAALSLRLDAADDGNGKREEGNARRGTSCAPNNRLNDL
ncbi:hypothetical protein C8F04DRAFT_1275730 [Mycena alexandri]|uniref:Uncharacterized protein n=1 Tax=Mycena alexandri TaxID=1745969 RepID=A0AAD6S2K4_9AGAR|nr:hypothetical protein C8F04DRAFT_1275730 [Mycena alexandri]